MNYTRPAERDERRNKVATLLLGHTPTVVMAQILGADRGTIADDVKAIRLEWKQERAEAFDRYSAEELAKLEALERVVWPKAMEGNNWSIDRILAIMERRSRLIGLDAPIQVKQDVTMYDGDSDLDREIAELLAKDVATS